MEKKEQKASIVDASLELLVAANHFYIISSHNIPTLAFFFAFLDHFNCSYFIDLVSDR
jgi:hypothetical protein